jgi:hypothetical protein
MRSESKTKQAVDDVSPHGSNRFASGKSNVQNDLMDDIAGDGRSGIMLCLQRGAI